MGMGGIYALRIYDLRFTIDAPQKYTSRESSGLVNRKSDIANDRYFIFSKFFWRICQSFRPLTLSIAALLMSASLAFLVGLLFL
jgi:hypothetical protein